MDVCWVSNAVLTRIGVSSDRLVVLYGNEGERISAFKSLDFLSYVLNSSVEPRFWGTPFFTLLYEVLKDRYHQLD